MLAFLPIGVGAQVLSDSIRSAELNPLILQDSLLVGETLVVADSVAVPAADSTKSPVLEAPIIYNATDSIIVALDGKKVYLYKDGLVTYQSIELKADYIELDLNTKEVYAEGLPDSVGVMQGSPVFKDGSDEFECKVLRYNFETQKGIIQDVKTEQGEGYVHSERTKKIDKDAFILKNGKYTTCDADHPHFYLHMTRAKVISNKKIITGPAYMVLEDFPIYFPILPFGFFPNSPTYSSGIIIPTYGEEQNRGFFLREGGYYWAAGQFFDLTMKGDIYSKGSWGTNLHSNYKKRYKFSGNVDLRYNVNKYSEKGLPDYSRSPGFSIRWSHSQDSKANPNQTFSANVNLSTTSYDRENSNEISSYLSTQKSSSISYSKKWENSPFNMSVNFRHSQNSSDSTMTLSFPEMTFSMAKQYPFRAKVRSGKLKWYEKIGLSYTGNIKNSITAKEDVILEQSLIKDWRNGWKHSIPITLPSFNLLKYINLSPSFNYSERWYTNELNKRYYFDQVARKSEMFVDTVYGFKRNYEYSYSLSSSTNIYGMYLMKNPNSRIKAIRHKITPSMSFSYRPDFGDPKYGFWDSYVDENGKEIFYNRFEGAVFGSTGRGESGSISLSLANNLEAKMVAKNDTSNSEEKFKKVKIIDNLGISASYNLVADSLNMSNISIRGRTTIGGVSVNFGGTLNPYMTDATGRSLINEYVWNHKSGLGKLGRLTNANLSFGMSFKSKKDDNQGAGAVPGQEPEAGEPETELPVAMMSGPAYYDFNIPWEFRFDYSLSYNKSNPFTKSTINQSINFNGRMSLTEKWNMSLTTNFDVQAKAFSFTTFNLTRSLHCWSMSFNFVPFGQRKSYSFTLNASSSMLKDLKVNKQRSWFDN
ncbi:putative LPS assembly protein LptD [Gaoshiqia sediminis]|uniref:LPS assembly protein LptD n=1 Tax=Gaoshiqia sediminis TaxID=2986998 RepID=A0AA41Y7A8_9BACT|nr:putative LPS assembly protein LptD [Gaoshiqia sediminis]MCW0482218.1 putative LPS assembly protein LptD [Gaoshiqia sediminis]